MINSLLWLILWVFLLCFLPYGLANSSALSDKVLEKINFDISVISPEGLTGSPEGLKAISYEFCIPANEKALVQIQAIVGVSNPPRAFPSVVSIGLGETKSLFS